MTRRTHWSIPKALVPGLLVAIFLLGMNGVMAAPPATPSSHLNAAGLVIKHGDGSILYYYVQFSEPAVAATDLLQRAGVSIDLAPYAGIGQAVCRIDGEGCPSTNCFCKSYSNPSVFWRYEKLGTDGGWVSLPYAASKAAVHDGDVVGFSWSSQDGDLPSVTLQKIAQLNGISLDATPQQVPPTSTPQPASTPVASVATSSTRVGTPEAVGVVVQSSGTVTPIDARPDNSGTNRTNYAWFGAGVAFVALLGLVVVARRRRGRP